MWKIPREIKADSGTCVNVSYVQTSFEICPLRQETRSGSGCSYTNFHGKSLRTTNDLCRSTSTANIAEVEHVLRFRCHIGWERDAMLPMLTMLPMLPMGARIVTFDAQDLLGPVRSMCLALDPLRYMLIFIYIWDPGKVFPQIWRPQC